MRLTTLSAVLLMLCVSLIMFGCADVPQEKIDEAQSALDAAKNAEADKYAPEMYNAAKRTLDEAMAMIEEEKSAMFSNYDEAIQKLEAAKTAANEAEAAVAAEKEQVKAEVEQLIDQVPELVAQTRTAWKRAPRGKGTRDALNMLKNEIDSAENSVSRVEQLHEQGNYLEARQEARNIINKLNSIQQDLQ